MKLTDVAAQELRDADVARTRAQEQLAGATALLERRREELDRRARLRFIDLARDVDRAAADVQRLTERAKEAQAAAAKALEKHEARLRAGANLAAGGKLVVVVEEKKSQRTFRIAGYLDAGHPLTAKMRNFYNDGNVSRTFSTAEVEPS